MARVEPVTEHHEGTQNSKSHSSDARKELSPSHHPADPAHSATGQPPSVEQISANIRQGEVPPLQLIDCKTSVLPVNLRCPRCHHHVTTHTVRQGQEQDQNNTCFLIFLLCAAGCVDRKEVTVHTCPVCGVELGRHTHSHS